MLKENYKKVLVDNLIHRRLQCRIASKDPVIPKSYITVILSANRLSNHNLVLSFKNSFLRQSHL